MKLDFITPAWALSLMFAITNASIVSQPVRRAEDRKTDYSWYWTGLSINTTTNSPISALQSVVVVPKFFPPATSEKANISFVLHLGTGANCGSSAAVGIDMKIKTDGTADIAAWSHSSYASGVEVATVHWLDEQRGKRFDIQPGDEVTLKIKTLDSRNLWVYWKNGRTGEHETVMIGNYHNDVCRSFAAWVTERRPGEIIVDDKKGDFNHIGEFGTVIFKDMQWGTEDAQVWNTGERKGPATEKWYLLGSNDGWGEVVMLRCEFFQNKPDITPDGMMCTQGKLGDS
ncbi:hypothetical protein QC763_404130 [Podospora pseudopauciseta]|uniref:Uncharacterized protein n=1 Tax=Podospora pseudopauciseta TaxID=2093780 RepID=A0ABR0HCN8_9PEZI|nr:hypothetical protein QC763_404130 [Podospora pseudopauciseta]